MSQCQICAREIKTVNGLIAAHGYKCPYLRYKTGDGHRTRPCFGSRHLPYEQSHDALDVYIPRVEGWALQAGDDLNRWLTQLPEQITHQRLDAYGGKIRPLIVARRPEGWITHLNVRANYIQYSYSTLYLRRHFELEQHANALREELAALRSRRESWKGG